MIAGKYDSTKAQAILRRNDDAGLIEARRVAAEELLKEFDRIVTAAGWNTQTGLARRGGLTIGYFADPFGLICMTVKRGDKWLPLATPGAVKALAYDQKRDRIQAQDGTDGLQVLAAALDQLYEQFR